MGDSARKPTQLGLGAVQVHAQPPLVIHVDEDAPLATRDTLPAPPSAPAPPPPPSSRERALAVPSPRETGTRRRVTQSIDALFTEGPAAEAQVSTHDSPSASASASRSSDRARAHRPALRVDEVATDRLSGVDAVTVRPRLVDPARVAGAPIDARDAFVLQLLDGRTSVEEVVDVSGIARRDVDDIVARLVRLGLVAI